VPPTLLSVIVTAVAAGLLVWLWMLPRSAALSERLQLLNEQLAKAQAELNALRVRNSELDVEKSRLTTLLSAERDALQQAQTRLSETFKALASDALSASNTRFLELARETFGRLHQQSADELGKRQQAIDSLVKPLRESLEKVDAKVAEIEKTRAGAYSQLSEQLKNLGTAQTQLQAEAARLSTALSATRTAGTWGELQLRRVVELAGMTAYCDFAEQVTPDAGGRDRADMVVRLPGGQQIVVDAKAPNDAYREAAAATDEATRALKLAEHAAKVRGHIDALGSKGYWEQYQPSPEFVVLFLPGDQFLAGALQSDPTLIERAIGKRILLTTPASLIALLKAAAYGWRQESVSKNAEAIAELGRQLHDRIATYLEHFERIGHALEAANKSYNSAVGSLEGALIPGARKLAELGAKGAKNLPDVGPVEIAPRDLAKRAP
jgi:DNA recombination protein RmuC